MNDLFGQLIGTSMTKHDVYDLVGKVEADILVMIFVVLKLTGCISWAWWSIFTPLYVLGTARAIQSIIETKKQNNQRKTQE